MYEERASNGQARSVGPGPTQGGPLRQFIQWGREMGKRNIGKEGPRKAGPDGNTIVSNNMTDATRETERTMYY